MSLILAAIYAEMLSYQTCRWRGSNASIIYTEEACIIIMNNWRSDTSKVKNWYSNMEADIRAIGNYPHVNERIHFDRVIGTGFQQISIYSETSLCTVLNSLISLASINDISLYKNVFYVLYLSSSVCSISLTKIPFQTHLPALFVGDCAFLPLNDCYKRLQPVTLRHSIDPNSSCKL